MSDPIPPSYREEYFVDREGAIELMRAKVRDLLDNGQTHLPHTVFYGPRGSGKSWLLRYLRDRLKKEFRSKIEVLYLDLAQYGQDEVETDPETSVGEILRWALRRLGFSSGPGGADLGQTSAWLVDWVRESGTPLVAFVDGLDEPSSRFMKCLESYYLAVLAKEPNVLLVLGGRGPRHPQYPWKMIELRYKVEEYPLELFDAACTKEQLQRLAEEFGVDPSVAEDVQEAGGGNPLSNVVLGALWEDRAGALQRCAEELLRGVPGYLGRYFRALCILPAVYEEQMPPLLTAYCGPDSPALDLQSCRRILKDMVATRLVRWQSGRGHVMDPAVRSVLTNALQENEPDKWEELTKAKEELEK